MAGLDHRTVQMRYVFLTIQWMRVVAIRDLDYYLLLLRLSMIPIVYCNKPTN